jgi:hypothetical protein
MPARSVFVHSTIFIIAVAISVAIFLSSLWAPRVKIEISADNIAAEAGYAYTTPTPIKARFPFEFPADNIGDLQASPLMLSENGMPIGPGHSLHDDIRAVGHGRYSDWEGSLYFSTRDNSDPRTNGRQYVASGRLQLWPSISMGVALVDFAVIVWLWRPLTTLLQQRFNVRLLELILVGVLAGISLYSVWMVANYLPWFIAR